MFSNLYPLFKKEGKKSPRPSIVGSNPLKVLSLPLLIPDTISPSASTSFSDFSPINVFRYSFSFFLVIPSSTMISSQMEEVTATVIQHCICLYHFSGTLTTNPNSYNTDKLRLKFSIH